MLTNALLVIATLHTTQLITPVPVQPQAAFYQPRLPVALAALPVKIAVELRLLVQSASLE